MKKNNNGGKDNQQMKSYSFNRLSQPVPLPIDKGYKSPPVEYSTCTCCNKLSGGVLLTFSCYLLRGNNLLLRLRWAVFSLQLRDRFCYKGIAGVGHSERM